MRASGEIDGETEIDSKYALNGRSKKKNSETEKRRRSLLEVCENRKECICAREEEGGDGGKGREEGTILIPEYPEPVVALRKQRRVGLIYLDTPVLVTNYACFGSNKTLKSPGRKIQTSCKSKYSLRSIKSYCLAKGLSRRTIVNQTRIIGMWQCNNHTRCVLVDFLSHCAALDPV